MIHARPLDTEGDAALALALQSLRDALSAARPVPTEADMAKQGFRVLWDNCARLYKL